MSMEEWRAIVGFEGCYEVSDLGRVRALRRKGTAGGLLTPWLDACGKRVAYLRVDLFRAGRRKKAMVHRLVAQAFLGPAPFPGAEVLHGLGGPEDASALNLRWGTRGENILDTILLRECGRSAFADEDDPPLLTDCHEQTEAPF